MAYIFAMSRPKHTPQPPIGSPIDQALVERLSATTGLPTQTSERIIQEVLAQHGESLEAFVLRRHAELKSSGELKNEQIYARIADEIPERRFVIQNISERQIRRLIYG